MNSMYTTFFTLLEKDIIIANKKVVYRSIDSLVWMSCIMTVALYIMPLFGVVNNEYGAFTLLGNLAAWGLLEMHTSLAMYLGDLEGDKTITYYLSLPLPASMVFIEQALASAYRSMATSLLILPFGRLMLGSSFHFSDIYWPYFILIFILNNIFYGFFTIFIVSYLPDLPTLSMVRSRILFPLWFLGGFQFTWKMLYSVNPIFAYVNLCNPITYVMDGMRATALPAEQFLPFWYSAGMVILFSTLFGYFGIRQLKKRLDCI